MEMKVLSENFEIQAANGIFFKWKTPEAYNSFPFLFPFLKERLFQLSDALPGDVDKICTPREATFQEIKTLLR